MKLLRGAYNPELMQILNGFSEWFMKQPNLDKLHFNGKPDPEGYYTSEEYLDVMKAKDPKKDKTACGYPNHTHGIDLIRNNNVLPKNMRDPCLKTNKTLNAWFGSKFCAVMMYYPPNGFMDWHTNTNCPGYNTLISYSHTGDGSFTYQDPKTKAFVKIPDTKGWSIKVGYFGSLEEPENIYWHSAKTNTHRLTFGYVIPDLNMWEMMCDDIKDIGGGL